MRLENHFLLISEERGFTLLEMIITLLLMTMMTMLLIQGLSGVYKIKSSLLKHIDSTRTTPLRNYWLKNIINGFTLDHSLRNQGFQGDSNQVDGITFQSLRGGIGVPTICSLKIERLEDRAALLYKEQGDTGWLELDSWENATAQFMYLTADYSWLDRWPQKNIKNFDLLPEGIGFSVTGKENLVEYLYYQIQGRKVKRTTVENFFNGDL